MQERRYKADMYWVGGGGCDSKVSNFAFNYLLTYRLNRMSERDTNLAAIRRTHIFCFKILLTDTNDILSILPASVVSIFRF